MPKGSFVVSPMPNENPASINFATLASGDEPPEDQLLLKSEVERTLHVLQVIYRDRPEDYRRSYSALLSLAQCGLVGDSAQPKVAKLALHQLRDETVRFEASRVKNNYLKHLGKIALLFGLPVALVAALSDAFAGHNAFSNFLYLWSSCMAGVWISFAARKQTLEFEELEIPERDMLIPEIRLIFAGLITLIIAFMLVSTMIEVKMGGFSSANLLVDPITAVIIGSLSGFSELILPAKLAKQATVFFDHQ